MMENRMREELKERLLTQDAASKTRGIAGATIIKHGDVFLVCDERGDIPLSENHGYGLYCDDCRWLDGYELTVGGLRPVPLISTTVSGFEAVVHLANERDSDLPREGLSILRRRAVESGRRVLVDELRLENLSTRPMRLVLRWRTRSRFHDVFTVRGLSGGAGGRARPPRWSGRRLELAYTGADGVERRATLTFPRGTRGRGADAELEAFLAPGESATYEIGVSLTRAGRRGRPGRLAQLEKQEGRELKRWLDRVVPVRCDDPLLDRTIRRAFIDLGMLLSSLEGREFFAAGLPWFGALFGRDALLSAHQLLAFEPRVAEGTLRLLAAYQGKRRDPWTDEEPGRILHELRCGELAALGEIPHTPYYGTVDAPLLFIILLGRHAAWTGRLDLFRELRPQAEAALQWARDKAGGGWLAYGGKAGERLIHQGWKDAGGSIAGEDGRPADPPLALVEVQAYWYGATAELARLYELDGDRGRAGLLRAEAEALKERFNRDFWAPERRIYGLALTGGRLIRDASSNAGHALWTGAADDDKASALAQRLMEPDLFSGWGVRTLSSQAKGYNPLSYHRGSVWPHDNALIAAGLRRYGFLDQAKRVARGILDAASHFPEQRLPELFCGLPREGYGVPVPYPVACHPQAWAAASVPYLLETCAGLEPPARPIRLGADLLPLSEGSAPAAGAATARSTRRLRRPRGRGTRGRAAARRGRPSPG